MKRAVIFDLDGVIVSTDEYHYRAWKKMSDEEGIYFNRQINERLRGVSRMASLEVILENSQRAYSQAEKLEMAARKNAYYMESLASLTPNEILPGAMDMLQGLRSRGILLAVGSSSRNTPRILAQIGLGDFFDAVSDGNNITKSKPDPEVFIKAAQMLGIPPEQCIVVEDAEAGLEAAIAGGMKAVGIGSAQKSSKADYSARDMSEIDMDKLLG